MKSNKNFSPVIILLEPQLEENIGAVARAMLNFNLHNLRIIKKKWLPSKISFKTSAKADEILKNTQVFENLDEAWSLKVFSYKNSTINYTTNTLRSYVFFNRLTTNKRLNTIKLYDRFTWKKLYSLSWWSPTIWCIWNTQVFKNLDEAINDLQYIYATSNRKRDLNIDVVNLKQGIKIISNYKNYKVGILFGPERSGLTNEHIALCDKIIEIPLNKNFKSLNLAQSVLLVAYELFNLNLSKINFVKIKNS